MKSRLLIVDDDEEIRTQMRWALGQDYEISLAGDREAALELFKSARPTVTMLDLGLPPCPNQPDEGLATLSAMLAIDPTAKIIIISGQGERQNALQAVGAGAYDFYCKPVELDELKLMLQRCVYVTELERENREMNRHLKTETFEGIIGLSPQMQGVFAFIRKAGPTNAPVLILGESGTGKEMAAMAIHRRSLRKDKPFVAINCNAIPENLLESELFGHEKGAFTGANQARKGIIEGAAGGTLFLDEIGELPQPIQVKLLRFLQEQTFMRVGGRAEIQIDTRVIAATNADLKQSIAKNEFREDLYFRLAVIVINLPALRERGEDIGLVAREFLHRYSSQNGRSGLTFSPEAIRAINRHSWTGNVRELQNRVQRAVIMADGKRISVQDLELDVSADAAPPVTLKEARESIERDMIQQALKRHLGKVSSTAAELGVSRPTLYELMEKLGISRE